jgi:tellurite resistance protein TehA-like permease
VGYTLPVFYAGLIDFFSNAASGHRETKLDALFIPVVGPIVAGNTNHASQRTWSLIWTDVAFQGAGVAVLLGGVIYHKPILVKDGIALAGVVPVASGDASTLVLAGTF